MGMMQPTMARESVVKLMGAITGKRGAKERTEAERVLAQEVVAEIPDMGWPVLPVRPATLDAADEELVRWYQAGRNGQTLKRAEQEHLRTLSLWRAAVLTAELMARARLATLLWAAAILQKWSAEEAPEQDDADTPEEADAKASAVAEKEAAVKGFDSLAAFCSEEYGVNIPPLLTGSDLERLLDRQAKDFRLLPVWLRLMSRVPRVKSEPEPPPQGEWFK